MLRPLLEAAGSRAMTRYVLCRRDVGEIGERKYCSKPIKRRNPLNWCEGCASRLPIWPTDSNAESVKAYAVSAE